MSGKATKRPKLYTIVVLCLISAVGYGEPSVGMGHIPVLWGIMLVLSGGLALIPTLLKKFGGVNMSRKAFWLFTLVPPLLFLFFIGSAFVAIGSIMITGRTM